jgi:hypothetical protein
MKVMFIDDKGICKECIYPKVGEIVTVVSESPIYPCSWYIAEYPVGTCGNKQSLPKKRFAPLSEIDEMELVNERELQTT